MKKIFTLLILLFVTLPFTACDFGDDGNVGDAYRFEIIAANGAITGYYSIDGKKSVYYDSTPMSGTIFHRFEQNLSSPASINVYATGLTTDATSISIYVYADSALVEQVTVTQTSDLGGSLSTVTATLYHNFTK